MKAYKYRNGISAYDNNGNSLFYRDVDTLFNNRIYAPTISELNDPNESNVDDKIILDFMQSKGNEVYQDWLVLKKQLSNLGIYSLNNTHQNELLWSYYATGHKGFAIEYNLDYFITSFTYSTLERMCYFLDINYSNYVPRIKNVTQFIRFFSKPDTNKIVKFYLGNKSKRWKHEEESRLILEKNGFIEYDYRAVTGIYFGFRMDNTEIDYIMNKMKGREINYYQMKLSGDYNLEAHSIEDAYYDSVKYTIKSISYDPYLISKECLKDDYVYKKKVKEAIEIVCSKPLVEKIISVKIFNETSLTICVLTKSFGIYPLKEFLFVLNEKERLYLIEDVERGKRKLQEKIKKMSIED